jgi:hypothetical protein
MGDAKNRKKISGDRTSKGDERVYPFMPVTRTQSEQFVKITTTGAWVGIGLLAFIWVFVNFIGPALGWLKIVH